jgi:RNA polymerase sigma-70 factor (ECF subfamily)
MGLSLPSKLVNVSDEAVGLSICQWVRVHAERSQDRGDVARAADGDAEAFERLYRATVGRVYALAVRMAGGEAADDLTQEVYLRAWRKLHTFRGDASFSTWLHRLAVNLILSRREASRKREARQVSFDRAVDPVATRALSPGVRLDLEAALARLPGGAREVFVLYDVEGYTHVEIAGLLGISPGTSKSQLHRARLLLRRHLSA